MVVIADDITGAAEMAGIAHRLGMNAYLQLCAPSSAPQHPTPNTHHHLRGASLLVLATDTRGMSEEEAVAETIRISDLLKVSPSGGKGYGSASLLGNGLEGASLFKKTDSALRGHVVPELVTLMETMGYQRAVFMPANPSKDRIIRNGEYIIKGVPIHETAFSYDPEFPAKTSVLRERFPDAERHHIIMPDAESLEDIRLIVEKYDDGHTLFAGAADLFEAWLKRPTPLPLPEWREEDGGENVGKGLLFLCGSTQSKVLDIGIPIAPMPREIYDGSDNLDLWNVDCEGKEQGLMLTIPYHHRTGKEVAVHLRNAMAEAAVAYISSHHPQEIVIEGGATAFCLLNRLGWNHFRITNEIAPGVVRMEYLPPSLNHKPSTINRQPSTLNPQPSTVNPQPSTFITLKPGSYDWGEAYASHSIPPKS